MPVTLNRMIEVDDDSQPRLISGEGDKPEAVFSTPVETPRVPQMVSATRQAPRCDPPAMHTPAPYDPGAYNPGTMSAADAFVPPSQGSLFGGQNVVASANSAAGGGSNVGYIDMAIPITQFRFVFDSAFDSNHPDRAEFFYAKCGCFRNPALPAGLQDPSAKGPTNAAFAPESSIDYQSYQTHLEYAFNPRMSVFSEQTVRAINPEVLNNTAGLSDMQVGFKYALVADPRQYFTFQFRTYIPTGDADRGLGTGHVSLEPAFLWFYRATDRLTLEAEVRDWIPVNGSDFAGNVVRYGLGAGYTVHETCNLRITPVTEVVGWSVLDGMQSSADPGDPIQDATGDTIVNLKLGVRFGFNPSIAPYTSKSSIYAGYGRALTGDRWYQDIARLEYRILF